METRRVLIAKTFFRGGSETARHRTSLSIGGRWCVRSRNLAEGKTLRIIPGYPVAYASREQRRQQCQGVSDAKLESLGGIETRRRWKGVEFWQVEHPGIFTNPIFH